TVTDVRPNATVDIQVPNNVRATPEPYARVTSQMVADGVWFLSGGTHNSALIEMKDHMILVESPINDQRALAVLAEVKNLVPGKPIRYLVNTHHHFDHAGGVRAVAGEGMTIITHEINRPFVERAIAARATVRPDHLAKAGRTAKVEGVRDQRVLTDGARTVEIRHIAGNLHHDGLIMVYLPREKILIEADAYTPLPPNATPPSAATANPYSVNLVDNLKKQNLDVEQVLPLHGRIVPAAELLKAVGHHEQEGDRGGPRLSPRRSERWGEWGAYCPFSRGSSKSRSASPSMLKPKTASESATAGQIASHGAWYMWSSPASDSIPPHVG